MQPVQLTSTEVTSLIRLKGARKTPQAVAKRAQIVLSAHAHPDWSSKQLAELLYLQARLIRKWRRRWLEAHSLQDAPRSGAPRRFSPQVRAQITALACSLPRSHGVALAHWSRGELARSATTLPTLPPISARTIGRWLTAEQIRRLQLPFLAAYPEAGGVSLACPACASPLRTGSCLAQARHLGRLYR